MCSSHHLESSQNSELGLLRPHQRLRSRRSRVGLRTCLPAGFPGDADATRLGTLGQEVGGEGRMEIQVGKKSGARSSSSSTGRRTLSIMVKGRPNHGHVQRPSSSWEASEQWEEECGVRIRPWLIILVLSGTTLWTGQVS